LKKFYQICETENLFSVKEQIPINQDFQHDETRALIHGFDEELNSVYGDSEGYIFANQVAKIIFHESE